MSEDHVEISSGIIKSAEHHSKNGIRHIWDEAGERMFFVDVVEADGGRLSMWSGRSYEQAIIEAEDMRVEWGPVVDRVV